MKRKLALLMLMLIIMLTVLSGCKDNSYENYLKAVEKTDNASKYTGEFSMQVSSDVDTEGLSKEELKNVNLYNNFEVISSYKSDKELGLLESNIYVNFGGLGFDIKYYDDSKKAFIKMPIIEKYLYMDELSSLNSDSDISQIESNTMNYEQMSNLLTDESLEALSKLWKKAIDKDSIVKGKESLIETKEGEIKATKYTIKYEDELFKDLVLKSMIIIYKDEKFTKSGLLSLKNDNGDAEFSMESIKKNFIDLLVIENFEINAYIDIDGYIVREDLDFVLSSDITEMNSLKKVSVSYTSKLYNIEKDQEINIPEKKDLEFMTKEEMENGLPSLFEDVFSR